MLQRKIIFVLHLQTRKFNQFSLTKVFIEKRQKNRVRALFSRAREKVRGRRGVCEGSGTKSHTDQTGKADINNLVGTLSRSKHRFVG